MRETAEALFTNFAERDSFCEKLSHRE